MNQSHLLDVAPVDASEYAAIEDLCREVLATDQTTLVLPGEAIVFLEAAARGLGRPGGRALNLVSGPYGRIFGDWLSEAGSDVENLVVPFDRAVRPEEVEEALERSGPADLVSLVHAEAATGVVNDVAAIAEVARSHGALVVVDSVAAVGAEPLAIDAWKLDLVVLSAQKALAGPSGATVATVSPQAWAALAGPRPRGGARCCRCSTGETAGPPPGARHCPSSRAIWRPGPWARPWNASGPRDWTGWWPATAPPPGRRGPRWRRWGSSRGPAKCPRRLRWRRSCVRRLKGRWPWWRRHGRRRRNWRLRSGPPGPLAERAVRVSHTGRRAGLTTVWSAVAALARGLTSLGYATDLEAALAGATETWYAAFGPARERGS